jgi:hypothetical protein
VLCVARGLSGAISALQVRRLRDIIQSAERRTGVDVVPEVFRSRGYVFFFYMNEGHEPMHVHVRRAGGFAKFWVEPVTLAYAEGMKVRELATAEDLIREHLALIKRKWHEVFDL